jgi:uncharacterized protein (DUF302 family)
MIRTTHTRAATLSALALIALSCAASAQGTEAVFRSYKKAAAFDDVKFDLNNAIIDKGLALDHTGAIGKMLDRTGADVGSSTVVYKQAEYLSFCSAKYSRRMMEADPANIAFCPFIVFIYEDAKQPGTTVVGYRRPPIFGNEASQKALTEIDAMLDSIVREAVK